MWCSGPVGVATAEIFFLCASSCTPPPWVYTLMLTCVRAPVLLRLCPTLYRNMLFLLIVLPLRQAKGVWRRSSQEVFVLRCVEGEMHKHRKCCFPPAGSSRLLSDSFRSSPSCLVVASPPPPVITPTAALHCPNTDVMSRRNNK